MNDDSGPAHHVGHVLKQLEVSVEVSLRHVSRLGEHARKDGVLIDGSILNGASTTPNDSLLLVKALVEKPNLHGKRVATHVAIKVFQVDIVINWLEIDVESKSIRQGGRKRRLAGPDHA
jgi:hypothetical protein